MRANLHELQATLLADVLLISERCSHWNLLHSSAKCHALPLCNLYVESAESKEPLINHCFARRSIAAILASIKSTVEWIKTVQLAATLDEIQVVHVPEEVLDFSQVVLRLSLSVLIRHLKNCISYKPVRKTGSKCGVHLRAISNELQSPAHFHI